MPDERRPSLRSTSYELNVGQFLKDHPGHVLMCGPDGEGYAAQRKNGRSHGTGPVVTALSLDELAGKLAQQEDR